MLNNQATRIHAPAADRSHTSANHSSNLAPAAAALPQAAQRALSLVLARTNTICVYTSQTDMFFVGDLLDTVTLRSAL